MKVSITRYTVHLPLSIYGWFAAIATVGGGEGRDIRVGFTSLDVLGACKG